MKNEIVNAEDYGIESSKANELTAGLQAIKAERDILYSEFEEASKLEVTQDNIPIFKELRLRIVKNRTQGINKWHKANKEFFLTGGKFVDAIKNKEIAVNEFMEGKLLEAEKYFENLEKERLKKVQKEREAFLLQYVPVAEQLNLAQMEDDVWEAYLATKKSAFFKKKEEEKKEAARMEEERKKAEEERKRILKENEELKRIAAEKEAESKKEREKLQKQFEALEAERRKKEAEELAKRLELEKEIQKRKEEQEKQKKAAEKEQQRIAAEKEAELSKGDEAKVLDLISDLEALKTKYFFKSKANKEKYASVCVLIDKIIDYTNK